MSEQSNDNNQTEFTHGSVKTEIGICSWCKDQIHPSKADEHASKCALIPENEREKILTSKENVVQNLHIEQRKTT